MAVHCLNTPIESHWFQSTLFQSTPPQTPQLKQKTFQSSMFQSSMFQSDMFQFKWLRATWWRLIALPPAPAERLTSKLRLMRDRRTKRPLTRLRHSERHLTRLLTTNRPVTSPSSTGLLTTSRLRSEPLATRRPRIHHRPTSCCHLSAASPLTSTPFPTEPPAVLPSRQFQNASELNKHTYSDDYLNIIIDSSC